MSDIGTFISQILGGVNKKRSPIVGKTGFNVFKSGNPLKEGNANLSQFYDYENKREGNPLSFIGDLLTQAGGGEPGAGVLDMIDPRRRDPMHGNATAREKYGSMNEEEDPVVESAQSPADQKFGRINEILGRDYSRGGKDFDKTHNWKDVLRGVGLGALKSAANIRPGANPKEMLASIIGGAGATGIGAGFDPNVDNKVMDEIKLNKLVPEYQQAYGLEQQRSKDALGKRKTEAELDVLNQKPGLAERAQAVKEFKAINDADYKDNVIALGQEKADQVKNNNERIFQLKQRGLDQNDKRIQMLEKRNDEIMRHNKASEGQATRNEMGRNARASMGQESLDRRQGLAIQAQKEAAAVRAAEASGRQQEAIAARERLAKLKAEYDALK